MFGIHADNEVPSVMIRRATAFYAVRCSIADYLSILLTFHGMRGFNLQCEHPRSKHGTLPQRRRCVSQRVRGTERSENSSCRRSRNFVMALRPVAFVLLPGCVSLVISEPSSALIVSTTS